MKQNIKIFLTLLLCASSLHPQDQAKTDLYKKQITDLALKAVRTRAVFHISRYASQLRYGNKFTFSQIAGDSIQRNFHASNNHGICIIKDATGAIIAINDGKKTPLALGSIPSTQTDINNLKDVLCTHADSKRSVEILTLNETWEVNTSGLSTLTQNNPKIIQYCYPTKDMTAPSLVDLIRAVHTLETRDARNTQACLVHCKSGIGRSATVMAAYLAHIMHQANHTITPQHIIAYLVKRRPQVRLNQEQKAMLSLFCQKLQEAGTLEALYEQYKDAISEREEEIIKK